MSLFAGILDLLTVITAWLPRSQSQKRYGSIAAGGTDENAAKSRKPNKRAAESSPLVSENDDAPKASRSHKRHRDNSQVCDDEEHMEIESDASPKEVNDDNTIERSPSGM